MASAQDIKNTIDSLNEQIDSLSAATPAGANTFTLDGKTYTRQQIESQVNTLKKQLTAFKKVYKPYADSDTAYQNALAELNRAKEIAANPLTESPTGMSQAQANAAVETAQKKVAKAKSKLDTVGRQEFATPKVQGTTPTVVSPGTPKSVRGFESPASPLAEPEPSPTEETPPPGVSTPGGGVSVGKTRKPVKPAGVPANWETKFRELFPSKAWMLDLDRAKYADVFKVIADGVKNRAWETATGQERFAGQLDNTSFIKELKSTNMVGQVRSLVGELGFDTLPFNAFLTKAMNLGWKGETLKQEVYKEAFRQDDTGNYVNPTALARAKSSNDYLSVQKIGKEFFSSVSEDATKQVLTGGMAIEDVQRQQRELAKARYGHLGNLIDQGFTLNELSSSFRNQAASLLEKDPNSIDMSQADFEQALNTGEEGKKRMMTSGEWEIKLRTDPRYNWVSTENAKAEARQLSASISQAFGKVM